MRLRDGSTPIVTATVCRSRSVPVFNLEVDGEHVYYVAASGVLVHNTCGEEPPKEFFEEKEAIGDVLKREKIRGEFSIEGYRTMDPMNNTDMAAELESIGLDAGDYNAVQYTIRMEDGAFREITIMESEANGYRSFFFPHISSADGGGLFETPPSP